MTNTIQARAAFIPVMGRASVVPFSADFSTYSDGAFPSPWEGSVTFVISSGVAVNTPSLGSETLADPGLEANYTAGVCDSYASKQGSPTVAQSADTHGGSKAQEFTANAYNDALRMLATPSSWSLGDWAWAAAWAKRTVSGNTAQIELRSTNWSHRGVPLTEASYTKYFQSALTCTANSMSFYAPIQPGVGATDTYAIDDLSLKLITKADIFKGINTGALTNFTATTNMIVERGFQGGLVLCADSITNPQNYVIAFHNQAQALLYKVVANQPTELVKDNAAYSDGRELKVIKAGNTFQLFYNSVQIGTDQTISDAAIQAGTYNGLFCTYTGFSFSTFGIE